MEHSEGPSYTSQHQEGPRGRPAGEYLQADTDIDVLSRIGTGATMVNVVHNDMELASLRRLSDRGLVYGDDPWAPLSHLSDHWIGLTTLGRQALHRFDAALDEEQRAAADYIAERAGSLTLDQQQSRYSRAWQWAAWQTLAKPRPAPLPSPLKDKPLASPTRRSNRRSPRRPGPDRER